MGLKINLNEAPVGGAGYEATGHPLPDGSLKVAQDADAVSEGSGLFTAEAVAKKTVEGIVSGHNVVGFGVDGWMLNHLTPGLRLPCISLASALQ